MTSLSAPRKTASIQQLHHRVVEDLIRSIIHGELPADHVLPPENLLAEQYGVSRTVVREAVRLLVSKGMLKVRQGSGTRVLGPEHWDFLDPAILFEQVRSGAGAEMLDEILESRRIIEGNAAALAARRRTGEDLAALRHHLGGMEQGLRRAGHPVPRAHPVGGPQPAVAGSQSPAECGAALGKAPDPDRSRGDGPLPPGPSDHLRRHRGPRPRRGSGRDAGAPRPV
ncbi:MAG: hypothetical protein C4331_19270 [Meiothermus sp.]